MKRKIYSQLLDWKNNRNGDVALLIEGARRIGKSYIVEEFARQEYASYILIDFNKVGSKISVFKNSKSISQTQLFCIQQTIEKLMVSGICLCI